MRIPITRILALTAVATLVLGACGSDDDDNASDTPATTAAPATTVAEATTTTTPSGGGGETVALAENTSVGDEILVDAQGRTLYLFMNDKTAGASTCNSGCDTLWPPLIVDGTPTYGDGLEASTFSTFTREDGKTQLQANGHPLYTFSQDLEAGEANGQGTGDVWYVVNAQGNAIDND
jgi:predicted lipoprotein with Yx(FWY)xxD motif